MTQEVGDAVSALVTDHVEAFNAHDRPRLLAGLAPDVAWSTGADTFHRTQALAEVLDDGLWAMQPSLKVVDLLVDEDRAAAQMVEVLTVEGRQRRCMIACFFDFRAGRIQRVKVYREGSADID